MIKRIILLLTLCLFIFSINSNILVAGNDLAPKIIKVFPTTNQKDIPIKDFIQIFYDRVLVKDINFNKIQITDEKNKPVPINIFLETTNSDKWKDKLGETVEANKTIFLLILQPKISLKYNMNYTVTIPQNALKDENNNLVQSFSFKFKTISLETEKQAKQKAMAEDKQKHISELKYRDWYFNEDYSKVTVNGQTFDNLMLLNLFAGSKISIFNAAFGYLSSSYLQKESTFEEYMNQTRNRLGNSGTYLLWEPISVNNVIFQDTPYLNDFLNSLSNGGFKNWNKQYFKREDISEEAAKSVVKDKTNNGYAFQMLYYGLTLEQAKNSYNINDLPVYITYGALSKTYTEFIEHMQYESPTGWTYDYSNEGHEVIIGTYKNYLNKLKSFKYPDCYNDTCFDAGNPSGYIEPKYQITMSIGSSNVAILRNTLRFNRKVEPVPSLNKKIIMIPLLETLDYLGFVNFDLDATKKNYIKIIKDDKVINFQVGSKDVLLNEKKVILDMPVQLVKGKIIVPIDVLSKLFSYKVTLPQGKETKIIISK